MGDVVLRVVSGALWSVPPKGGTEGDAKLERLNVNFKGPGSISWRAVATGDNQVRIEATVAYPQTNVSQSVVAPAYGKLSATYSASRPLPDAFTTQIRGLSNQGNFVSAEFKLR
jgi:hypothetical protein